MERFGHPPGLVVEEAPAGRKSDLIGKNPIESGLGKECGVIVAAIKRPDEDMNFNPLPTQPIEGGDAIVVLGERDEPKQTHDILQRLAAFAFVGLRPPSAEPNPRLSRTEHPRISILD